MKTQRNGYASALRRELIEKAATYVAKHNLEAHTYRSLGQPPVILYRTFKRDGSFFHGNFLTASYQAILLNDEWCRRLQKPHPGKRFLQEKDRPTAKELDSCCSSDALLMNIFCHPETAENTNLAHLFEFEKLPLSEFGWKPQLPMVGGGREPRSTEIDMRFVEPNRTIICESKLTEADFTRRSVAHVYAYEHFHTVFDELRLPRNSDGFLHYQLIRNILAAHNHSGKFCLLYDKRRPDLEMALAEVKNAIKLPSLVPRCCAITWQTVAKVLSEDLRIFLGEKYGIS